jgi:hypothetical protein
VVNRDQVIDALWALAPAEHVMLGRENFAAALDGWDLMPVEIGGLTAFVILTKGPLIHFRSLGTRRPALHWRIRAILAPIIAAHGYVETDTPRDDARQIRFNQRIGFAKVGEDDAHVHFRMTRHAS